MTLLKDKYKRVPKTISKNISTRDKKGSGMPLGIFRVANVIGMETFVVFRRPMVSVSFTVNQD